MTDAFGSFRDFMEIQAGQMTFAVEMMEWAEKTGVLRKHAQQLRAKVALFMQRPDIEPYRPMLEALKVQLDTFLAVGESDISIDGAMDEMINEIRKRLGQ